MIKTFLQAAKVHRAYSGNAFVYYLKRFPIIGRLVKDKEYGGGIAKTIADIAFFSKSILGFCLGNWIYLAALYGIAMGMGGELDIAANTLFPVFFIALLPIGILLNNTIRSTTQDKYYDIILLRMNARNLAISSLIYKLIRLTVGYVTGFALMVFLSDLSPITAIMLILASVFGKFFGIRLNTYFTMTKQDKKLIRIAVCTILAFIAIAAAVVIFKINVPSVALWIICGILTLMGVICIPSVINYKHYPEYFKIALGVDKVFVNGSDTITKEAANKSITFEAKEIDTAKTSNKSGFAYFNQIFVLRHRKLLDHKTKLICIASVLIWGVIVGFLIMARLKGETGISNVTSAYPALLVIPIFMYYINQGDGLIQAMFYNCDNAMLTYNFYRKPEIILGVFKERLKTIISYNLIIAAVLSAELFTASFLIFSGNFMPLVILAIVMIFATGILFSIHKLVLYYLIQPYTDGVPTQKPAWGIINTITYFVCFSMAQLYEDINPPIALAIAIGIIVFTIAYMIVAMILVKKYAPLKFKLNR